MLLPDLNGDLPKIASGKAQQKCEIGLNRSVLWRSDLA
jgi:hypothetical protein